MIDQILPPVSAQTVARTPQRLAYFVSDSTGITAETLGSALLVNFPAIAFERRTVPFVDTVEGAAAVVREIDEAASRGAAARGLHDGQGPGRCSRCCERRGPS